MMKYCSDCGSDKFELITQTFSNGKDHTRKECVKCRKFMGFAKQHNGFDKLVIKDLEFTDNKTLAQAFYDGLGDTYGFEFRKLTVVIKAR